MIRNTKQRDDVRAVLSRQDGFVSAQELHQQLHAEGSSIGLATVYRALSSLVEAKEADSLTRGTETVYRACQPGHHHHLVCRECGLALEISAKPIEQWARDIATEHGFAEPEHVVDVFGLCPGCQKTQTGN